MSKTDRLLLVVGVGRSGTSLTMQALARIGAGLSKDLIPASEFNRRGAYEDREVRDRLTVLGQRFGHFNGHMLPTDWQKNDLVRETRSWLEAHLDELTANCEVPALAIKFPLSSIFLPIWYEAATTVGLDLRPVWATRRAEDVIASLSKAGSFGAESAKSRFLLRIYSLLMDLAPNTLLLPYEGWWETPEQQIRALADVAALPISDLSTVLSDLFDPELDHGGSGALAEDPILRRIDKTLASRRGRASDLFGPDLASMRQLAGDVAEALPCRKTTSDETGKLRAQLALERNQIRRLEDKVFRYEAELAEVNARAENCQLEAAQAAGSLADLRIAYQKLTWLRDTEETKRNNLVADYDLAVQETKNCLKAEEQKAERNIARAKKAESRADAAQERLKVEEQKTESNIAWAKDAESRADAAERSCQAYRQELQSLHKSIRWRMGDMISEAARRPRFHDLLLPVRLVSLWLREKRRR